MARMRSGVPLDDAARWPWLRDLAAWMAARHAEGVSTVLACSALKRSYRDVLRQGPPDVEFVHLAGAAELIRDRMSRRAGHYMPASLLDSQRAILEHLGPDESWRRPGDGAAAGRAGHRCGRPARTARRSRGRRPVGRPGPGVGPGPGPHSGRASR